MICPNCGRELADGEICVCTSSPENGVNGTMPPEGSAPDYSASAQYGSGDAQSYYAPGYQQPPVGQYYAANQQPNYYNPPVGKIPARTDYPDGYKIKKKYVAVILGATLGFLGVHNWYLGNRERFLAQILIGTVGSLLFGIGAVVTLVWSMVETVMILTENIDADAMGYKIETFEESIARANRNKD